MEGLEEGRRGREGYKIQKVLYATPCCKLSAHKNKLPALVVGFFFCCVYICMHGYKGHVQVAF